MAVWMDWLEKLKDPRRSPYERRYRLLSLMTSIVILLWIIVSFARGINLGRAIAGVIVLVIYTALWLLALRYRKTQMHARSVAVVLIFLVLPATFIFFGGIQSGAPYWCLLTMTYTISTVSGAWKYGLIACDLLMTAGCFIFTYLNPEYVVRLTLAEAYLNAVTQLTGNLLITGSMFFFQFYMARQEREILTEQQNQIELLHLAHNTAPVTKVHNETGDGEKHAVQIAVDSGSDLPAAWVEYYRIAVINNHIRTDRGVFDDVLELNTSALFRYMDGADHTMHSDPPSVEEFRDFFARLLEKAGRVVFITLGKHASKSFERASAAAKQFRQVTVIDSGHLSSAAGMLAVYAAHLSQTEPGTDGFFDKTDQFRQRIRCSLLLDNTGYMARNGKIGAGTHKVMQAFLLHPVITAKNGAISTAKIFMGNPASVREKYIRYTFARENRIDPSLVIVVYAGLPDSERKEIGAAVLKQMPAARIVFQELSAALAGNAGPGTFGFIYCETDIREKDGAFDFLPESLLKENVL